MLTLEDIKDKNILELLSKVQLELSKLLGSNLKNTILYGSYARLENTKDSDIDIMVLVDGKDNDLRQYEDNITDIMVDLSLEYDVVLSIISENYEVYNNYSDVLPFFKNIKKEGMKLR